jgi:hypothetical protein
MILTATLCVLAGAVLGLKFNAKMLAYVSILVFGAWAALDMSGFVTYVGPMIRGSICLASLQTGYFVTILLFAMGFTDLHSATAAPVAEENESLQAEQSV